MIDINLVDRSVSEEDFIYLPTETFPCLFIGHVIKNEYDNKRLVFSRKYKPIKFFHIVDGRQKDRITVVPLFGCKIKPVEEVLGLIKTVSEQKSAGNLNLPIYRNILSQYGLSCDNSYSFFSEGCYPIDFTDLSKLCSDKKFSEDPKILQHILGIDENKFNFQAFAAIKIFILVQ